MSLYRTKDGDRIDLIVLEHYGDLRHLNDVISANPSLWDKPMDLVGGMEIVLPEITLQKAKKPVKKERSPLW